MMNSAGLNGVRNTHFEQHAQRNQATTPHSLSYRQRELWSQILDMGSKSDCELSRAEAKRSFQNNERAGNANNAGERTTTEGETTQTKMFVNAQGERILAIKTGFGFKYLKIGYEQDFLLSSANSETGTEIPYQNQAIQQMIGQYEQMLSTQ